MTKESYLSEQSLANRWGFTQRTLQRWRSQNKGPAYINMCGHIRYRKEDIEAFEKDNLSKKRHLESKKEVCHD
jgi:hypothetical protein